jgi:hypothetical protein
MTELEKYQLVNRCQTIESLEQSIDDILAKLNIEATEKLKDFKWDEK